MLMYLKDITLVKNNKRRFIVSGFFEQFCAPLLLWNWSLERSNDLISFNRRVCAGRRKKTCHLSLCSIHPGVNWLSLDTLVPAGLLSLDKSYTHWPPHIHLNTCTLFVSPSFQCQPSWLAADDDYMNFMAITGHSLVLRFFKKVNGYGSWWWPAVSCLHLP